LLNLFNMKIIFSFFVLFAMLFPTQVVAESQDFTLSQDTYANLAYPDKVNASQQVIIISNKNTTRLGYIQFEDINLPEGAIVDRGILKLYFKDVGYADVEIYHRPDKC